ncbi:MAG: DUF4832 domain-containing protein [Terriglobia bacterium]
MVRKLWFCIPLLWLTLATGAAQTETVIVRPKAIDEVLVNPGMGIQTFQRFNGQAVNAGLKWSEEGPTARLREEARPPDFPASSLAYCRWFWEELEPEHGKVRWEIIDQALEEARTHGQTLDIRLMPYDQGHPLPEWYRNSGARRANRPTDHDGSIWQPDFTDPIYLKYWGELVAAAGARYDGHPYLDSVDVSSVGYWGEGWSDYMPAFPYQKALIDIWFEAFKRTPLLMNFDQEQALAYGTQQGAGWRLDCWGDMRDTTGGHWCHMLDFYPLQLVRAGTQDIWQRSPVSLETCWVPGYWKKQGWDVNYILEQALRWHVSSVNIKSSAIPPEWKTLFEDFQKKMGYRFILRRLEYARGAKAGAMIPLHLWWLNAGVAPVYRPYELAIQILSPTGMAITKLPVDVRKWLPGDSVYDGTLYVPAPLKSGDYRLRVALLDPRTQQPAIRLAIEGRQPDGWYDLGSVSVE